MKRVLLTGGSGFLALNWAIQIRESYKVNLLMHRREVTDITDLITVSAELDSPEACLKLLKDLKPDIVINTAGLTNIEKCEENYSLAFSSNAELPKNLALACEKSQVKFVHISTDHLFDGKNSKYSETDSTNALNNYGKTKLLGEELVLKNYPDSLVIRTNFFGWGTSYRSSFSDFIINNLRNHKKINLFTDVFFAPVLVTDLIEQVHLLIESDQMGIFNISSDERISKYDFGLQIAKAFKLNSDLITPVSINHNSKLTRRPKDMSLSNEKLLKVTSRSMPSIYQQCMLLKDQEKTNITRNIELKKLPYGRHFIDEEDISSVVDVLKNGQLTQGPKINEFENKISTYVGSKYAVAVSSGTAALHLACAVLEIGNGDGVITSPNTFVATSNSILYVGAEPQFVDIDHDTLNINSSLIEKHILESGNIKAIIPVHFAGASCDMVKINNIAKKYNLRVIEDASHALGAAYIDQVKIGSCKYSDLTVFSFHPVKGIAAGEGGVVTTNDYSLYRKLMMLRSHGISKGNFEFPGISKLDNSFINKNNAIEDNNLRLWYYEMQFLGFNYRITDIQCALAISQLNKISEFIESRRSMVKYYDEAFKNEPNIEIPQMSWRDLSSHHIYVIKIDFDKVGITRNEFMKNLSNNGVGSQVHYIPVVMQPFYQMNNFPSIDSFPVTKEYYERTLSLPLFYGLRKKDQDLVIETVRNLLK